MNVAILCPFRADGGHRDRLWEFTKARWEQFGWPIVLGESPDGPFNRSAAVNDAARKARDADVFVIVDNDVIANPEAVRTAVDIAYATDRLVVSHNERVMLNKAGTEKVLAGYEGPWRVKQMVQTVYTDSVSCCIAVSRKLWDTVGGFPEFMAGWGHEDSVFAVCASTLGPGLTIRLASELFHLHHEPAPEAPETGKRHPLRDKNRAVWERFKEITGDPEGVRALLEELRRPPEAPSTRIPRTFHRTVPAETSDEVEQYWQQLQALHPGWTFNTYRDPLDPKDWPLIGDLFKRCQNGAQLAGLVRLEALVTHGGVYVDSDVKPCRSFEPLLQCQAFAGWEDETTLPDAVLGAEPNHPAFVLALEKARSVIEGGGDAYQSGPAVTTEILPNRPDVLCLPPGAFYPHSYLQKNKSEENDGPWVVCRHMWHGSWLSDKQRASIEKRQRA